MKKAADLFLFFLIVSVLGWAYEVFLEVVIYQWGYSDRGVLFGPYCPVYGFGALLFLLCFGRLLHSGLPAAARVLLVFLGCMAAATLLELATSYLLEALTGSWPWQTYRNYRIQFEGRIALSPSIRFGLGGLLILYGLLPLLKRLREKISLGMRKSAAAVCAVLFITDVVCTGVQKLF